MTRWRASGFWRAVSLLASCALALLVGLALVRTDPLAARSTPSCPTVAAVAVAATPTTNVPATIGVPPTVIASPLPTHTIVIAATASTAPPATVVRASPPSPPSPTAVPRVVVGRWQDHQVLITEAFATRGPWRICWSQPDPAIPFQVMVGDAGQIAWELYSAPVGATVGQFDLPQGGAFRLMIHAETPYDVVVLDGSSAGVASPPPCG